MEELVEQFYAAFNSCDADAMVSCYHPSIRFSDPAFGILQAEDARAMWHMLCENQKGKGFKVEVSQIRVDGNFATAHWEAWYTFSKTGRSVHNRIKAHFQFQNGLIIVHDDEFNVHHWAKQALGFKGWLLGSTSFFQRKLQQQTRSMLKKYMAKNNLQ